MKKTTPTHTRTIIAIAFHSLVIIALIVVVLIPSSRTVLQKLSEYSTGQEQNRLLNDSLEKQQDADRAASTTLAEMGLDQAIMPETKALTFIEELETIASSHGVEHTLSFLHTARQEKGNLIIIPITLRVSGTWNQITNYLVELENSAIYLNPDRIVVSTEEGSNLPDEIQQSEQTVVFIQANTYWSESK